MGVKGLMQDGFDFIKTKAADAAEEVKRYANGMRGQSTTTAQPDPAAAVDPTAEAVKSPRVGPNPNVGPGRPSPEATAYQAQPKGPFPNAPSAPSNKLGKLGVAGVVAGEAMQTGPTLFDQDVPFTEKVREGARSLIRGGATVLGGAGGAAIGSLVPGPGTVLGGVAGGAGGYAAGDYLASQVLGPKQVRGAPVTPPTGKMPPAIPYQASAAAPQGDDLIDTTRGLRVSPQEMIAGNQVPVQGQGAFKVGNRPAVKVGARSDGVQIGDNPAALPVKGRGMAGAMVNLTGATIKAHEAAIRERGAYAQAQLGIKAAQAGVAIKKTNQEIAKGANDALDKVVNDHIAGLISDKTDQYGIGGKRSTGIAGVGGESEDQYKTRVGQAASETKNRINYTLANRKDGKNLEDLSDTESQQLLLLDRLARKVTAGRQGTVQQLRDLFGNKQFDSNDLYSYAPTVKLPSSIPGNGSFYFQTANGNTLTATRALGGDWNITSPNGPVDKDIADFINKQIEARKKGTK